MAECLHRTISLTLTMISFRDIFLRDGGGICPTAITKEVIFV